MPTDDQEVAVKDVTLMLQTGYPFIGLPFRSFNYIAYSYEAEAKNITTYCPADDDFGFCYWKQSCESLADLLPNYNLSIGINANYSFELPLNNLMTNFVTEANELICRLQIAMIPKATDTIVLGDAFFTGFVGIFDLEHKRLGLAKSVRSLPGNTMYCYNSSACSEPIDPYNPPSPGPGPDPTPTPIPGPNEYKDPEKVQIIIIDAFILILILIFVAAFVYCVRKNHMVAQQSRASAVAYTGPIVFGSTAASDVSNPRPADINNSNIDGQRSSAD